MLFDRLYMPSLKRARESLNSDPLGLGELRGHVVVVDFRTLTRMNWLRPALHIRAWSEPYRDDGLVVIGEHTPEFSFEQDVERVREATAERRNAGGGFGVEDLAGRRATRT
jgi:hypothetical protein